MAGLPLGRFDANLGDIMQDVRQIDRFLDVVFEFLYRRTDFYHIMKHENDKMGLPPGIARKYVMQAYMKYEQLAHGVDISSAKPEGKKASTPIPEAIASEIEVSATDASDLPGSPTPKKSDASPGPAPELPAATTTSPDAETGGARPLATNPDTGEVISDEACGTKSSGGTSRARDKSASSRLNPADTFNGALRESYAWSQTLKDVDIKVFVPSEVTKAKQLRVDIGNDSIKVVVKGSGSDGQDQTLVDGRLTQPVRGEETIWSLEPGNCVQINLEKRRETWWKAALVGEPEIDQGSIDSTQYVHEMDEESQTDYQRVMTDMERKRKGLPTTKEQEAHDMLRKAWNAEGSPFKGTDFDPSKVNISAS